MTAADRITELEMIAGEMLTAFTGSDDPRVWRQYETAYGEIARAVNGLLPEQEPGTSNRAWAYVRVTEQLTRWLGTLNHEQMRQIAERDAR